jgi:hypothetical protein
MNDQTTCGTGLAAHARLPATISELLAAMANTLDAHQQALDVTDENAKPEHHAYVTLVLEFRSIGSQLGAIAQRMTGYRDLPMGRHDAQKMSGQEAVAAFQQFVRIERALLSQLTEAVGDHEAMLRQMR